jgi:predicted DCC family thiol-disulfide oxidoreductase YuxK
MRPFAQAGTMTSCRPMWHDRHREPPMRRDWHSIPADDLPDRIILFDGVCVLCSRWVAFVIRHDRTARYRFVAIQTPLGGRLAARYGVNADYPETNVVVVGGRAYFKLESALAVLAEVPGWRWTRIAYALPRVARDLLYDAIAQNRYRLFGRHATCLVPTPDVRARFLSESFS